VPDKYDLYDTSGRHVGTAWPQLDLSGDITNAVIAFVIWLFLVILAVVFRYPKVMLPLLALVGVWFFFTSNVGRPVPVYQPQSQPVVGTASDVSQTVRQVVSANIAQKSLFKVNPDAALFQRAQELGFGNPTTDELKIYVEGKQYVAQGFRDGALYVEYGHWDNDSMQILKW
jgi:hypothetical protein